VKKTSITISYDEERLSALKMYLDQKNMKVEDELEKALEALYTKNVPAGVRDFLDMKSGTATPAAPRPRKQKPSVCLNGLILCNLQVVHLQDTSQLFYL